MSVLSIAWSPGQRRGQGPDGSTSRPKPPAFDDEQAIPSASPGWELYTLGAERIGEFWSYPQSRTFAELLIDCEEDRRSRRS